MRKIFFAVAAISVAFGTPSFASGNQNSNSHSQGVGNCISDGLYGNEPNMANGAPGGPAEQTPGTKGGNVLPTQSPGPSLNNPSDPSNPTPGPSVGDINAALRALPAGVAPRNTAQLCKADPTVFD